jgi:hypothetical protein
MCRVMSGYGMTLDRPDDDAGPEFSRPEQQRDGSDRRVAAPPGRVGPAEPRTIDEYYEALRMADGKPPDDHHGAANSGYRGWGSVEAADRPPVETIHVSPDRAKHVLDGDADGSGGHRHGTGNPGKTEFPATWDDEKIINALVDVARRPDHPPRQQEWNHRWVARGTRDDVEVVVVIAPDGRIWTGWPTPGGPGVVKNPKES